MEKLKEMNKCDLCKKRGENLSLLSANHKEHGRIMVCRNCWVTLYSENHMIWSSGSSGKKLKSSCSSCSGCSYR